MRLPIPVLAALLQVLGARTATAHDCWIRPDRFDLAVDTAVAVRVLVGHGGDVLEFPRREERSVRFEVVGPAGTLSLPGWDGRRPAGFLRATEAGSYVVVHHSRPTVSELDGERFSAYLREEGLDDVLAEREASGETGDVGREGYARCAKALVRVGSDAAEERGGSGATSGATTLRDRAVGLPYEAIVETDLARWRAGDALVVRLEWQGGPIDGRQVRLQRLDLGHGHDGSAGRAASDGQEPDVLSARTDGEGRVRFDPPSGGVWMASSVHMRRADAASEVLAARGAAGARDERAWDWESFWASSTFELRAE
jgi:hypothetical protein